MSGPTHAILVGDILVDRFVLPHDVALEDYTLPEGATAVPYDPELHSGELTAYQYTQVEPTPLVLTRQEFFNLFTEDEQDEYLDVLEERDHPAHKTVRRIEYNLDKAPPTMQGDHPDVQRLVGGLRVAQILKTDERLTQLLGILSGVIPINQEG